VVIPDIMAARLSLAATVIPAIVGAMAVMIMAGQGRALAAMGLALALAAMVQGRVLAATALALGLAATAPAAADFLMAARGRCAVRLSATPYRSKTGILRRF
jgi:hypothetical protein